MAIDLSILIVSYNTREQTLACLDSIFRQTPAGAVEVIVVDNASSDSSAEAIAARWPRATLIRSARNLGFAAANNLAATQARGRMLLLLNPDTVLHDRCLQYAVGFADRMGPKSIVGGRTFFADGSLNPASCHGKPGLWSLFCAASGLMSLFRNTRLFDPESLGRWARDTVREVDIVSGCFLLIHRTFWDRLGGFDPAFFMYGEDADLCARAWADGGRCVICPDATLIHHGGASEPVRADKLVRLFSAKAMLFRKHWTPAKAVVGTMALDAWAATRTVACAAFGTVRPASRRSMKVWASVFARRGEWRPGWSDPVATPPTPLERAHT
jgi:hypothetical protein